MIKVPDPPAGLIAVGPREWMLTWRRVIAPGSVKLVGSMAATWADYDDGSKVHPGNDILAAVCGIDKRTVGKALGQIREWGLVWRYFEGSKQGRRGNADEYRLTIPEDIFGRVPMLDPEYGHPVDNYL